MNSTSSLSFLLQNFDLSTFLTQNKHLTAEKYLLQCKGNTNELNWLLAEQINIYPKALRKLPQFAHNHCWFTSKSYEQASGEALAIFKSTLVQGKRLLDLSGGLGVDDWAFSKKFKEIVSLDPDINLNNLVRFNYKKMDISNIERIDTTAENYLNKSDIGVFDMVFLDSDRRIEDKRNFFLDQCTPNILELRARCLEIANAILLKISPMVDLSYLISSLPGIEKIWVVGDKTEVKEILVKVTLEKVQSIEIIAVQVINNLNLSFSNKEPREHTFAAPSPNLNKTTSYIFEPHPSIIKAGISLEYASYNGLNQIAPNSFLLYGNNLPLNFIGRAFKVIDIIEFSKSNLSNYLKKNNLVQANITRRNFKQTVDDIRKVFKLSEGGDDYLFFTTNLEGNRLVIHGRKPSE